MDEHNQKGAGKITESVKLISPSKASAEKKIIKAVKRRLKKSAQEKKEQLIKPLSTVKKPKRKKEDGIIWLLSKFLTFNQAI